MPLTLITGDPLTTDADVLAFGYNARGRNELDALIVQLQYRQPAAFSAYGKRTRAGKVKTGEIWVWREAKPALAFLAVRESSTGASRVRYVYGSLASLLRDAALSGWGSIAIAALAPPMEMPALMPVLREVCATTSVDVRVYE
jgi:hypothetical protein